MKINPENYISIQGWMRTDLELKGNDLLVYAIIYGFSQTEDQKFTGSLQYLADWCGATKQGILKNINNLLDRQLIVKEEYFKNNVKFVEYYSTMFNGGIKHSLTNNIDNNKEILSKDKNKKNNSRSGPDNFLGGIKKEPKQNLYGQCISMIDNFITINNCFDIRTLLIQHLDVIVEQKKLRGKKQYQGILNKLQQFHEQGCEYKAIIEYSIEHGYPTFYEIKPYSKKGSSNFVESGNKHVESFTKEDEKKLHEFQEQLRKEGKQIYF